MTHTLAAQRLCVCVYKYVQSTRVHLFLLLCHKGVYQELEAAQGQSPVFSFSIPRTYHSARHRGEVNTRSSAFPILLDADKERSDNDSLPTYTQTL